MPIPSSNVSETIASNHRSSALNSDTPGKAKIQFQKVQQESGGLSDLPCALATQFLGWAKEGPTIQSLQYIALSSEKS